MIKTMRLSSIALLLFVAACASSQPPSLESMSMLPVIEFGGTVPTAKDYILFFPAGKPIPLDVAVKGNIFARDADQRVNVTLRKDIYAYKEWISYDRVTWRKGRDAIKSSAQIRIPGYQHPEPGLMKLQMDERG
jgi:hypothetical protein